MLALFWHSLSSGLAENCLLKCVPSFPGLKRVGSAVAGPRAKLIGIFGRTVWKEEDAAVMVIGMV